LKLFDNPAFGLRTVVALGVMYLPYLAALTHGPPPPACFRSTR
jgi:hypothetical protein